MTVGEALRFGTQLLTAAGVDSPALDTRLLLGHAMALDASALLRDRGMTADMDAFRPLLDRRLAREPVALILGWQEFWSLRFGVSSATLIPRADSETLIEAALAARPQAGRLLDLGTGTGCLLLAALSEYKQAWGLGIDYVQAAAVLAMQNAASLGLDGRACFVCADWAAAVAGPFDLVFSNPPYIETAAIAELMPEVAAFEPASALDGGQDGLSAYRALLLALPRLLAPDGLAVFELGCGQAGAVCELATASGFRTALKADLAGVPRALLLEWGLAAAPPALSLSRCAGVSGLSHAPRKS